MGKPSRDKGMRIEREIVNLHKDAGIGAERVPLSGAAGGSYTGDVRIAIADRWTAEVKGRGNGQGFVQIERWLANHELLFLRRDYAAPLVVMPWHAYLSLIRAALRNEGQEPRVWMLEWRIELPSEEGWYFYRNDLLYLPGTLGWEILRVVKIGETLVMEDTNPDYPYKTFAELAPGGQWQGPITPDNI